MDNQRYQARWIFPSDSEPIEHGVLEIQDNVIVGFSGAHDPKAIDLGNVAIIPGLVNAHTHLEFSDLAEPIEPAVPFDTWIRNLVGHRMNRNTDVANIVGSGLRQSQQHGVVAVGEIATQGWSSAAFKQSNIRSVVFRELIGLLDAQISEQASIALAHLEGGNSSPVKGLSPHAPFSVHPELLDQLIALALSHDAPIAMHVAETKAELELLRSRSGSLVEMLQSFGVWNPSAFATSMKPVDILRRLATLNRVLVIHGNYLDPEEIDFLSNSPQFTVVYCPRTHAFFQHSQHPWLNMLESGVSVAIGTDGRGSNPDLSIWNELKFLHGQRQQLEPSELLRLGTDAGATALKLQGYGVRVGSNLDLSIIDLPDSNASCGYQLLFDQQTAARQFIPRPTA